MNAEVEPQKENLPAVADEFMAMMERLAKDKDVDPDKLGKLLDLQERVLNKNAEAAFYAAMRAAQEEMAPIKRNARNQQTSSNYATLEAVNRTIKPIYTKHGFSLSFGNGESPLVDHIRVTCDVSHIGGFTKPYFCDVPIDMTGLKGQPNKTRTHAFGSTNSYGRRYLTLMIFNLSLTDEDDDGNGAGGTNFISENQIETLRSIMDEIGQDETRFLRSLGLQRLEDMPAPSYDMAVSLLDAKRKTPSGRGDA